MFGLKFFRTSLISFPFILDYYSQYETINNTSQTGLKNFKLEINHSNYNVYMIRVIFHTKLSPAIELTKLKARTLANREISSFLEHSFINRYKINLN